MYDHPQFLVHRLLAEIVLVRRDDGRARALRRARVSDQRARRGDALQRQPRLVDVDAGTATMD
jgi:hypothetical protein